MALIVMCSLLRAFKAGGTGPGQAGSPGNPAGAVRFPACDFDMLRTHVQIRTLARSPASAGHGQRGAGRVLAQCTAQGHRECDQFPAWPRIDGSPASIYPGLVRCGLCVRPVGEQRRIRAFLPPRSVQYSRESMPNLSERGRNRNGLGP